MTEYDLCVVGAGMIGSAAARHASIDPKVNVCLIGPPEPKIRSFDDGCDIYGSHYDEGRITTSLDPDPVWATLAQQSIKRYRDIKKASGIPMYNDVGTLIIRSDNSEEMSKIKRTARDHGVVVSELNHATLTAKFPYLRLADDDVALYEDNNAGYISPRKLVEAQKVISKKQGCTIIHDVVCSVERVVTTGGSYVMKVVTEGGRQVLSKAVLVATGGFTLFRHLLPAGVEPDQQLRGLTVSLLEVDEEYKKKLKYMPAVNCKGAGHPDLHKFPGNTNYPVGFYMLPPITYPDGRDYIKLGYYHDAHRVFLSSSTDVKQWFVNGNTERAEDTAKLAVSLFKGLKPRSWHGDFCIMTETPTGRPYIDTVHSQLGVAIGGNSTAAKSSDEIGRLAAGMMFGRWDSTIARDVFKFRFAQDKRQQLSNSKL